MRTALRPAVKNATSLLRTKPLRPRPLVQAPSAVRSLSTTPAAMSLLRPSSLFSHPFFSDLDTLPFGSSGFPALASALAPAAAPGDYFRRDSLWSGPRIDIHEEEAKYVLSAELPGVKKEDVKINVDADRRRLTIEGQMKSEYTSGAAAPAAAEGGEGADVKEATAAAAKGGVAKSQTESKEVATKSEGRVGHPLVSERVYGSFSRTFTLPTNANLSDDKALKARFRDGLLELEIPKKTEEVSKARSIAIE